MTIPASIEVHVNGEPRELPAGTTVSGLVRLLGLRPELVAVEVNRDIVPRPRREERTLLAGDRVELVTMVGGG